MTYRDLISELENLEDDQLDLQVYALMDGEYYSVVKLRANDKLGQLQEEHPFLCIK